MSNAAVVNPYDVISCHKYIPGNRYHICYHGLDDDQHQHSLLYTSYVVDTTAGTFVLVLYV